MTGGTMSPLGCLVLVGVWSSSILADTGVFFPHTNVRLRRSPDKLGGGGGAGTGYGAPAEEDYSDDYEGTAPEEDYNYDVNEESEAAAASEPGGGYLAPAEDTPEEADASEYDYSEDPEDPATDDYDYDAESAGEEYDPPAEEEEVTELGTGYLAPEQSEGRRARNNRPATRKIAEELVSNARQLVRNGPNANDLKRLNARQNNGRSKGRRSRNNRPRSQTSGNEQGREKPNQNSVLRRVQNEKPKRRQNGTQKRGKRPNGRKASRQNENVQSAGVQCPGGSLDNCIDVCPGTSAKVYVACVNGCSSRCEPQANPRRRN